MSDSPNFDAPQALEMMALMERIRAFEEQACVAAERGLVLGALHPSIGQEAVAAGLVGAMRRDDILLSTHRGHGHTLAKGADPLAMMRELLGREGGCCGGKGGSMHIADFSVGMLGANGVVGANITIAAGAAHGLKIIGGDRITVCIFGDGAINRGPFLEGLNWAGVFDLPILFVCEDNRYSSMTCTSDMTAGPGPVERAASLGLNAAAVDGNDVIAVREAAEAAFARIRANSRPEFLHAITYRQTGHTTADAAAYRPEGEAEAQRANNDPITRLFEIFATSSVDLSLASLGEDAKREMTRILEEAEATPFPDLNAAFDDVQDAGSPAQEAY